MVEDDKVASEESETAVMTPLIDMVSDMAMPDYSKKVEAQVMNRFFSFCKEQKYSLEMLKPEVNLASKAINPGTLVVANLTGNFILARIISYVRSRKKYKVEDADETTDNGSTVYELDLEDVIPLPCENAQGGNSVDKYFFGLSINMKVLAMFPGTTSFYAATIVKRYCDEQGVLLGYRLKFEEDEDESGQTQERLVSLYHVVQYSW